MIRSRMQRETIYWDNLTRKRFLNVAGPEAGRIREVPRPGGKKPSGERKRKRRQWRRSSTWSARGRSSPYPGTLSWWQSSAARTRCPYHGTCLFLLALLAYTFAHKTFSFVIAITQHVEKISKKSVKNLLLKKCNSYGRSRKERYRTMRFNDSHEHPTAYFLALVKNTGASNTRDVSHGSHKPQNLFLCHFHVWWMWRIVKKQRC